LIRRFTHEPSHTKAVSLPSAVVVAAEVILSSASQKGVSEIVIFSGGIGRWVQRTCFGPAGNAAARVVVGLPGADRGMDNEALNFRLSGAKLTA
jgi:hypothetical protein